MFNIFGQNQAGLLVIVTAGILAFGANTTAATIYKWVDENGKTHYGDRAAGDVNKAEEVRDWSSPSQSEGAEVRNQRTNRLLDSLSKERADKRATRESAAEKERKRKANCTIAKNRQVRVDESSRFYDQDENGERVYLNDEQVEQFRTETQRSVDEWCK
ncbi:MAG: DUF4124 domain-containing protein [Proteobacteria bacterium]|nr:DUF4124 domain-containing protein [Pseudomonadota bacterium]